MWTFFSMASFCAPSIASRRTKAKRHPFGPAATWARSAAPARGSSAAPSPRCPRPNQALVRIISSQSPPPCGAPASPPASAAAAAPPPAPNHAPVRIISGQSPPPRLASIFPYTTMAMPSVSPMRSPGCRVSSDTPRATAARWEEEKGLNTGQRRRLSMMRLLSRSCGLNSSPSASFRARPEMHSSSQRQAARKLEDHGSP
mmetsp:Transcript_65539/g.186020  ORF Transcript_65539/g.186020 Transcript_65539/m.186020 type:complete len:201 (-) Transcript_65539:343-945(-)